MSIQAVNQFLTKVSYDKKLQTEFIQAMGINNDCAAGVKLAAQYGYQFTPQELATQIEKVVTGTLLEELSEEQLDAVAGGYSSKLQSFDLEWLTPG